MLNVIKNLVNSEKAVALGLLVIAASVLAALGKMSIDQWISYTEWMAGFYVGGKSIQGAAALLGSSKVVKAEAVAEAAKVELQAMKLVLAENDAAADAAADK